MIDFAGLLDSVRQNAPLVHSITNYVTINDCANILLACGASPIMADDPEEVAEITGISDALVINLGTLHQYTVPGMFRAGKRANELGHPVVLDPVGAGASNMRTETALRLLDAVKFTAIRGNASEIRALTQGAASEHGVDADEAEGAEPGAASAMAGTLAAQTGAVVAMTGATDVISDGARLCLVRNGHPMMRRITGTGCMLSALTAAFVAANPGREFEAVCAAVIAMGVCGETAHARLGRQDGSAAMRTYLMDAVFCLRAKELEKGAKYEMRSE